MSKEYIAAVLKKLRCESGMTADEVGALIGKSGKTVNGWENGRSQPDAEILLKLCDIYKVDDILTTFMEIKRDVEPLAKNIVLTSHESDLVIAYRNHPEMQDAVDRLLGVSDDYIATPMAARSESNRPTEITYISKDKIEQIKKAESVEDKVDL